MHYHRKKKFVIIIYILGGAAVENIFWKREILSDSNYIIGRYNYHVSRFFFVINFSPLHRLDDEEYEKVNDVNINKKCLPATKKKKPTTRTTLFFNRILLFHFHFNHQWVLRVPLEKLIFNQSHRILGRVALIWTNQITCHSWMA